MTLPLVYIVLVNYKNWQDTAECLESVFKLENANFKVVVVDNDSQNGSVDYLEAWANGTRPVDFDLRFYGNAPVTAEAIPKPIPYKRIAAQGISHIAVDNSSLYLVDSDKNLGFAGGNNLGIALALAHQADYIWLLNNDTVVAPDTLSQLQTHFLKSIQAGQPLGILGARLLYFHDPNMVQAVMGRYNPMLASTEHIGFGQAASARLEGFTPEEHDYVVGASMFISADFLNKVGPMSEDYFLYFEEIDWAKRGQLKGFVLDTCPHARVYHKEGASIGGSLKDNSNKSELSDFYSIRNRLIVTSKFYRKYLPTVYFSLIFVALNRIRRKQTDRMPLLFRAFKSYWKNTP